MFDYLSFVEVSDMKVTLTLYHGIATVLLLQPSNSLGIIVRTVHGLVKGNSVYFDSVTVDEYLGVPFAEPPVGSRRFRKPEPIRRYLGDIIATHMPPGCPQYKTVPSSAVPEEDQSENCLYLNIWVPRTRTRRKAVMFWIYGGGFSVGGNRLEINNGKVLAANGDVLVVTVNYRLNALGFLYSGTEDAPGNVGLHDILLGLKWVRTHIAAFGGDPDNITLFGQSAGAIIIGTLAVSPLAKGLYNRAILESGAATYLEGNNATKNSLLSQEVAKAMDCADDSNTIWSNPTKVVSCLRGVDAYQLAKATALLMPDSLRVFQPQFGDDIVPKNTRLAVIDGDFIDTDLMIGDVTDEGSTTLIRGRSHLFGLNGEKNALFNKCFAEAILKQDLSALGNIDPIVDHYLDPVSDDDYKQIRYQTYTALGDKLYVCPNAFCAERYAGRGNRVYFYFFAHRPSTSKYAKWMGVTHFSEVQFLFGLPISSPIKYTKEETKLSLYVMKKWSNFAKFGNPGPEWPLYTTKNPQIFRINSSNPQLYESAPLPTDCYVYRRYFGFDT